MALAVKAEYPLNTPKVMPYVVIIFGLLVLGLKGALALSWLPRFG
jgi:hypothetical protein